MPSGRGRAVGRARYTARFHPADAIRSSPAMRENIVFTDQAKELAAKAREIADKYVRPGARKYDRLQEYNWEAARAVADAGLFRTFVPVQYGGLGAGILALAMVTEELAKADSGFGVAFAVNALGSFPILVGGTEEQKQRWLPQI